METVKRQLVRLHRDTTGHAQLLEEALPRIERFSRRFGGDAKAMTEMVWGLYAQKSPLLGLWLAMEGDAIAGHVLGTVAQWDNKTVCWINQAEMDTASQREFVDAQIEAWDAWVREVNQWYALQRIPIMVRDVMMQTPWIEHAKAFARGFGLEPYRLICRREVK